MSKILLTGGTGFIGKRLLPKLALKDEVFLLVRKESLAKARKLVIQKKLKNVKILPGDLEQKNLGFSEKDAAQIFKKVDYVYHLAASYDLSFSRKKIFGINLGGIRNLVSLLENTPNLKAFIYISTAYVAGEEEGTFLEDKFIRPRFFRNAYEEAKFESEAFLREMKSLCPWKGGVSFRKETSFLPHSSPPVEERGILRREINLPVVIIRPSVVVGDSETGEFEKEVKSGFYQLIRAIDKGLFFFYPGKCDGFISAVPVDWVVKMIFMLGQKKNTLGKTFHLADLYPLTAKEFIDQVSELLGRRKPFFQIPNPFLKALPPFQIKKQILMLNQKQIFDMTNTLAVLGEKENVPSLRFYLRILINYYRRHLR